MTKTFDLGRLFFQLIRLKRGTPFAHRAPTYEISPPYRRSTSLILHVWPGHGLVIGIWKRSGLSEEEALRAATQAEDHDPLDEDGHLLPRFYREYQPET